MTVDLALTVVPDRTRRRKPGSPPPGSPTAAGSLARSLTRVAARGRLHSELRAIALDLLGPHESGELPSTSAAWVDSATDAAVSSVTDAALAALVRALDLLLADAPPDVARGLDQARTRHDAGFI